jgi:MinD-like ATPase involved in chromosome partitioning or flagellar assembly
MAIERYTLAGLSITRSEWFSRVDGWSNSSTLPIDFVKCVSIDELRMRVKGGQNFSAVMVDAEYIQLDRELETFIDSAGALLVVIGNESDLTRKELRRSKCLPSTFERTDLARFLAHNCRPSHTFSSIADTLEPPQEKYASASSIIAVTGPGGTGTSTVAMILSQLIGQTSQTSGSVVLLDGKQHPELAMLHDTNVVAPSIHELADACRFAIPSHEKVRDYTFHINSRNYDLLLGAQTSLGWAALRPERIDLTFATLRSAYDVVVADIAPEFDGESTIGSIDIEEHNYISRYIARSAQQIVIVGRDTAKGLFSTARVISDLIRFEVSPNSIQVVIIGERGRRFEFRKTKAAILDLTDLPRETPVTPLPYFPEIEAIHHDVSPFPRKITMPLVDMANGFASALGTPTKAEAIA